MQVAAGSLVSQYSLQQPVEPMQFGTVAASAQKRPGSQTFRNSQGSPKPPVSPPASGEQKKPLGSG